MDVLITYDVADTDGAGAKRLRSLAQVCERYGERVQFSVFECRLSPTKLERMINEIQDAIDAHADSVAVYRFTGKIADSKTSMGKLRGRSLGDPWIV